MALPSSTYDTATLVNPGSSLTDFTLIVDLSRMSAAWWSAVDTTDGTKGRAAKDSGPTELACDWIDFDSVNETGLLRVKWSGTLATSGTQTLRVYPPMAANASVAANATYGSDNAYDADWDVYIPDGGGIDRTSNNRDATPNGDVVAGNTTGKIGQGTTYDGANDYSEIVADSFMDGYTEFTMLLWVNSDSVSGQRAFMSADWDSAVNAQALLQQNGNKIVAAVQDNSSHFMVATSTATISVSTWVHAGLRYSGVNGAEVFVNGAQDGAASATPTAVKSSSGPIRIGNNSPLTKDYDGISNDVQIHSTNRDDAWIDYEFEQTNDQATLWGTWTNTPVAGGISIPVVMHHRRMMGVS